MKSLMSRILRFSTNHALAIFVGVAIAAALVPTRAFASDNGGSLDSGASVARIFLGSARNPESVNIAVAQVSGTAKLDPAHLDRSVVDLNIYPAGEDWGTALNADGDLPAGYVPDNSAHTLLTFKSSHVSVADDGKLLVTGDLTLTRVERSVTADANEAYAGPVYGAPTVRTETEQITFVFPGVSSASRSAELVASTRIKHEDFRLLSNALTETHWPAVVANERCEQPSTVGEDYSGVKCTGTEIASISAANCQMSAPAGEDYHGLICAPPAGDLTTIELDLKFNNANAAASRELTSTSVAAQ